MVQIILSGCNGRMGQVITGLASEMDQIRIVAGVDLNTEQHSDYPVYESFEACEQAGAGGDVIIDFSSPAAYDAMMDYVLSTATPAVVCTTGLNEEQLSRLEHASHKTAVLRSANMSLGINLLMKLVRDAAKILAPSGFDIEIEERHHKRKKDAPSGTALALADAANEALGGGYSYVYDRSNLYEPRGSHQIGISSVRGGTIVGEHTVLFAGDDEVIELKHTATSRAIFAKGALAAAVFLAGQAPGYYGMDDVIESVS